MRRVARIRLQLDKRVAATVADALMPELNDVLPRTEVDLNVSSKKHTDTAIIELVLRTTDLSALRAALNSYLRWINCCIEVCKLPWR
jgi:tRNA threonylcarbamoyladenosine modification (KEOPS) complex  Pcc1 subunit